MKKINQKHYPKIEVDTREKDIVQLWQNGDVIQIERENIKTIIDLLIRERLKLK